MKRANYLLAVSEESQLFVWCEALWLAEFVMADLIAHYC